MSSCEEKRFLGVGWKVGRGWEGLGGGRQNYLTKGLAENNPYNTRFGLHEELPE